MVKHTRVVSSLASNMAGIYGQPGPTHGPHGTSGDFLYNNRPAIIYFDSGLTPEVVTRSSPYGDVKEQPMEVGDAMYHTSSGMVNHSRVVSSLLPVIWQVSCIYSMMTQSWPCHHQGPTCSLHKRRSIMYLFQGTGFHLITPAPFNMFNGPDLGSTHMQDLTPAPHSSSWAKAVNCTSHFHRRWHDFLPG